MKPIRTIAFIADLHVFSRYALNPPTFHMVEGSTIESGKAQKKIYKYWLDFCKVCDEAGVDTVVIDGDVLHGQNFIERGTMLYSPNMDEQEDAAVELLEHISKKPNGQPRKLLFVPGSGYHVSTRGHSTEKDVCERLGGKWLGPIANLMFAPSTKVFNVAHGESASYIYREMLMGREGLFIKWAEALGKVPHIDVVVRAHWHQFIYIHANKLHLLQLPSWICYEPSKPYLKSYGKMQSDIGGVIVNLDEKDRVHVWHYLYESPHIADAVKEV